MSNDLMQFAFEGHSVRIHLGDDSEPWWVAADVCGVLGLADVSAAVSRLKTWEKRD